MGARHTGRPFTSSAWLWLLLCALIVGAQAPLKYGPKKRALLHLRFAAACRPVTTRSSASCALGTSHHRQGNLAHATGGKTRRDQEANAEQLWGCSFDTPRGFDNPQILRTLYGASFSTAHTDGQGSIVVLGHHNSGTSMLTRLLMLMGAFHGNLDGLSTSPTNRLKYWEKLDVSHYHDLLLGALSDKRFRPYQAQGVDRRKMTKAMRQSLKCFVSKIVYDLDRHWPWVLKDPRMMLFADSWLPRMKDPVCVFIYRDPLANAISLTSNSKKSAKSDKSAEMTVERWLDAWEEGSLAALSACRPHPTLILQLEDMQGDLTRFAFKLYAMLGKAGVIGLQMPKNRVMRQQFGSYLKERRPGRSATEDAYTSARLTRSQEALHRALQMVSNSPDYGLGEGVHRAEAVMSAFEDLLATWNMRSGDAEMVLPE